MRITKINNDPITGYMMATMRLTKRTGPSKAKLKVCSESIFVVHLPLSVLIIFVLFYVCLDL